jgi:hypothetical protein
MDASLANMISADEGKNIFFVDFEYEPASGITLAMQRVYDHLRLVESTWKFIHKADQSLDKKWMGIFCRAVDKKLSAAEFLRLEPALTRILASPAISAVLREQIIA